MKYWVAIAIILFIGCSGTPAKDSESQSQSSDPLFYSIFSCILWEWNERCEALFTSKEKVEIENKK